MKLGEALQERNHLQQSLSRLQKQRQKLFSEGIKVGGFDYDTLTKEIMETHLKINDLKLRIIKTNLESKVTINIGDKPQILTLQEAILEVTTIKSELSEFSKMEEDDDFLYRRRSADDEIVSTPLTSVEVAEKINELEKRKRAFNHAIQGLNWNVSLVEA